MKKILILSVGGSCAPLINAIKGADADFVYFFCSKGDKGSAITVDGSGDPCGDKRQTQCPECGHKYYLGNPKGKAIVVQAGLDPSKYEVVTVDDPDDLNECHSKLLELERKIRQTHGDTCKVVANYTGGTKTMSVAIVLAGLLTEAWELSLNVAPRSDIIKVTGGDVPVAIDKWRIFCQNQLEFVRKSLRGFDYSSATSLISEMLSRPLERSLRTQLIEASQICQAFEQWDKFQHDNALRLLETYGERYSQHIIVLKRILAKTRSTGYEIVGDLLNNAARKAHRKHYDDAVARLYRAMELFAQVRLLEITVKDQRKRKQRLKQVSGFPLELSDLPEELQKEYETWVKNANKLLLGLREDYELLLKLDDPLGREFKKRENKILTALNRRNLSIGAHGLTPLEERAYHMVEKALKGFIHDVCEEIRIELDAPQFPQEGIV